MGGNKKTILWIDEPETWIVRRKDPYAVHYYANKEYPTKEEALKAVDVSTWEAVRVVTE